MTTFRTLTAAQLTAVRALLNAREAGSMVKINSRTSACLERAGLRLAHNSEGSMLWNDYDNIEKARRAVITGWVH